MAATDTRVTTEEPLEAMFSERSVPKLYREDHIPLPVSPSKVQFESPESAERECADRESVEKWEFGSWGTEKISGTSGTPAVKNRYQTTTAEDTADWEHLVPTVVNCKVCDLTKRLQLLVVTAP
jgi:hypothetical protein